MCYIVWTCLSSPESQRERKVVVVVLVNTLVSLSVCVICMQIPSPEIAPEPETLAFPLNVRGEGGEVSFALISPHLVYLWSCASWYPKPRQHLRILDPWLAFYLGLLLQLYTWLEKLQEHKLQFWVRIASDGGCAYLKPPHTCEVKTCRRLTAKLTLQWLSFMMSLVLCFKAERGATASGKKGGEKATICLRNVLAKKALLQLRNRSQVCCPPATFTSNNNHLVTVRLLASVSRIFKK